MQTNSDKVQEFMQVFGQKVRSEPTMVEPGLANFRYDLISEELSELLSAMHSQNIIGVADALGDLLYVVYGAAHTYGIPIDRVFAEIHRSNMSKLGADGKPLYRPNDGKVMKGPNYSPPDLSFMIEKDKFTPSYDGLMLSDTE